MPPDPVRQADVGELLDRIQAVMNERHGARMTAVPAGELSEDEIYQGRNERVRTELMNLTGYFHSESSHHASEYWAWFRKSPALVSSYLPARWDYFDICTAHPDDHDVDSFIEESRRTGLRPPEEYGAYIIDSMTTGTKRIIYGNVPNQGLSAICRPAAAWRWPAWSVTSASGRWHTANCRPPAQPSTTSRSTCSPWSSGLPWRPAGSWSTRPPHSTR